MQGHDNTSEKTYEKSSDLIFKGTAHDFIECLAREVLSHEAVNHEYLNMLKNANFKNKKLILRDYAYQYSHYSNGFTRYLKNVVQRLSNKKHKDSKKKIEKDPLKNFMSAIFNN